MGQRFLDRFAEVHGRRPEYIMPIYGHDVGQAFVAALERAEPLSPRGVMEALERVKMPPAQTSSNSSWATPPPGATAPFDTSGRWLTHA